jgi:hypothetical protein
MNSIHLKFISILLASTQLVSADPVQKGHYALYRQMEFSNACAIYEVWWPYAVQANQDQQLDTNFLNLINDQLIPNIGSKFGHAAVFAKNMQFYMKTRINTDKRDIFSPIDCIAYQYFRSSEQMWSVEKINNIILADPDFWFGKQFSQDRLAEAAANEILLCFAANGEWGTSCGELDRE